MRKGQMIFGVVLIALFTLSSFGLVYAETQTAVATNSTVDKEQATNKKHHGWRKRHHRNHKKSDDKKKDEKKKDEKKNDQKEDATK